MAIIHEIYDAQSEPHSFEAELERSLEDAVPTIVIEPRNLGEHTARSIVVGNLLHKTAVLSSVGCLAIGVALPTAEFDVVSIGLALTAVIATGVYTTSWQFDPCSKYQVEARPSHLNRLPMHDIESLSPVVLVRVDDSARKWLHNVLTAASATYAVWRLADILLP